MSADATYFRAIISSTNGVTISVPGRALTRANSSRNSSTVERSRPRSSAPVDERQVPEANPRSNAALVRRLLLAESAAKARFVPLFAERVAFPKEARSWQQFFVAFRRVMSAGHAVRPAWLAGLGKRLLDQREEPFGMAAIHRLENVREHLIVLQQRNGASAERGIYGQYFH